MGGEKRELRVMGVEAAAGATAAAAAAAAQAGSSSSRSYSGGDLEALSLDLGNANTFTGQRVSGLGQGGCYVREEG